MSNDSPATPGTGCPAELTNICARRHWSLYWLFIAASVALLASRVLTVGNYTADGSPFRSANDRSRWATIRSLGDDQTYEIDEVIRDRSSINWDTIDRVRHLGDDGQMHDYSSKPTLLPTLLAGPYVVIQAITGWGLEKDTTLVVRTMLFIANVLPFAIFLWIFAKYINSIPVRDWSRYYMMVVAGWATFLSTFAISLNNHLPAAVSVMIALYCLFQIWQDSNSRWHFVFAGLFGAFAAANELPALSFLAVACLVCFYKSAGKTISLALPAAALVAAGFFGTNYLAHGDWKPAYTHRTDGELIDSLTGNFETELNAGRVPPELLEAAEIEMIAPRAEQDRWPSTPAEIQRWVVRDQAGNGKFAIRRERDTTEFGIHAWSNWYDYPGSYWNQPKEKRSPVDQGEPSRLVYLFHVLFGHHGILSLTPVWLIAFAGLPVLVVSNRLKIRWIGVVGILLTVVVITFYVMRPELDRNYGGQTSCLRWLLWLSPFWLTGMLPVVDWLGKTNWGRWVCFSLLALSIISANYSAMNPWVHPWLYEIWDLTGLPK